jgi:tRNA (pseudouridine54-N1)-methyltransferase
MKEAPHDASLSTAIRRFVIVGHNARTDGEFNLKDIPGTSGRLDVLARCVTAGLLLSNGIRKDTLVYLLLRGLPGPAKALRFEGKHVKNLNPDERSSSSLIQNALRIPVSPGGWLQAGPGIDVALAERPLFDKEFGGLRRIVMAEDGESIGNVSLRNAVMILGGHTDLIEEDVGLLGSEGATRVSLGSRSLHADHCVTVAHHIMDSKVG